MTHTKEECEDALLRAKGILGHSPTVAEYRDLGLKPSYKTISRKFGSWNKAKEELGLSYVVPTYEREPQLPKLKNRRDGYEFVSHCYGGEQWEIYLHRLVAVAHHGVDELRDKVVHHKNEVKWDNRPDNLEVMTASEHKKLHHEEY